jgi:hypothetical protein
MKQITGSGHLAGETTVFSRIGQLHRSYIQLLPLQQVVSPLCCLVNVYADGEPVIILAPHRLMAAAGPLTRAGISSFPGVPHLSSDPSKVGRGAVGAGAARDITYWLYERAG